MSVRIARLQLNAASVAEVHFTTTAGHVIASQTLLDIKGATRAGHGGFGEPFLVELLLLVFSHEFAENRFAKAQLHELTLFGVLLERQILQYDALRLRDGAILDRTMPCTFTEPTERK